MGRRSAGRNAIRGLGALSALVALVACSPQSQAESSNDQPITITEQAAPDVHPVSGLAIVPLRVITDEERIGFRVELADTREAQARGLMFRTELGDFEGMIFPYDGTTAQSFWMKNTPLPLDIIFIGPDRTISNIAAMTTPYSLDSVYSVGPVLGVLELRGGRAAELGIEPGDRVEW
ncbi:DUF192 domain-containing protein [Qipengyuania flava]|uniref:DUF192 domain-containing protein n=1 Tax=Qipengyuania flava TaxID=192812 RepID=UPI001C638E11|nr:DUF192 domain-containing protein [Qipengyuania flava]QYJ06914.1 DUF192 domain-containing protein [Qipengyuania flava]